MSDDVEVENIDESQGNDMQDYIRNHLDDLLGDTDLRDVAEQGFINNKIRYGMMRLLNEQLKVVTMDSAMLGQWRAMMKDIDATIFKIAQIAQDDRSLDNEEMVAKALSEVTRQISHDPYRLDDGEGDVIKSPTIDKEFEFVDGSEEVGLSTMDYQQFANFYKKTGSRSDDETENDDGESGASALDDAAPAPPKPGEITPG